MTWNPYSKPRTEPDLRQELNNTLDGVFPEIAKKQTGLLRRMKRNNEGKVIYCACVDEVTKEADVDHYCSLCQGEGKYWEEIYIDFYRSQADGATSSALGDRLFQPGLLNIPTMIFYIRSSDTITEDDRLVELILDSEGDIIQPIRRRRLFRIGSVVDYRSDNGRLEYWRLSCYEEKRKFLNGPQG